MKIIQAEFSTLSHKVNILKIIIEHLGTMMSLFKNILLSTYFLFALTSMQTYALEIPNSKNSWSVPSEKNQPFDDFVIYKVSGNKVSEHLFGFLKPKDACSEDLFFIIWSSYNDEITHFFGQNFVITFSSDHKSIDLEIPLDSSNRDNILEARQVYFYGITATSVFFKALEGDGVFNIKIKQPNSELPYFDIPEDYFNLEGLRSARLEAAIQCLKAETDENGMYLLSQMLINGQGVFEDETLGEEWIFKAAKAGNAKAMSILGLFAENNGDHHTAYSLYLGAANKGNNFALFKLAEFYRYGSAIRKNEKKALSLFTQAAIKGDMVAAKEVADMTYRGIGTEKNESDALKWVEMASDKNVDGARYLLAEILYKSKPPIQDKERAYELFLVEAKKGHSSAMVVAANLARSKGNYDEELNWLLKASASNHTGAKKRLIRDFINGRIELSSISIVEDNLRDGIKDKSLSIDKHIWLDDKASLKTKEDYDKAGERIKRAAILGLPKAQFEYAKWLRDSQLLGGESYVEAMSWLKISQINGYAPPEESIDMIKRGALKPVIDASNQLSSLCMESNYKKCELEYLVEELK